MKTKFFRVATSGKTVDGREITPAQIDQMASSYDPTKYGARINLEHLRSLLPYGDFKAYGDVLALKAEDAGDGQRALLAQIDATDDLVALNKAGQKVYWSIEMDPNFTGTGKAYMVGLAMTDSPASVGTEMLKFSLSHEATPATVKAHFFSVQVEGAKLEEEAPAGPSIMDKVREIFGSRGQQANDNARFGQLEGAITEVAKQLADLSTVVAKQAPPPELTKLAADLAALKQVLETTSPQGQRPPSPGPAGTFTATDC